MSRLRSDSRDIRPPCEMLMKIIVNSSERLLGNAHSLAPGAPYTLCNFNSFLSLLLVTLCVLLRCDIKFEARPPREQHQRIQCNSSALQGVEKQTVKT